MPRKTAKFRQFQMIDMIVRSGYYISPNEFKFKYLDPYSDDHIYAILMPITLQWENVRISSKCIAAKVLPMHVCDLIDQVQQTKYMMERARDMQVFCEDIKPISEEERRLFGTYSRFLDSFRNIQRNIQVALFANMSRDLY